MLRSDAGARQVAGALSTGSSVLVKPAGQTPGVAWQAARLLIDAGVPAGVLALPQWLNSASKVLAAQELHAQAATDLIANAISPAAFAVSSLAQVDDEIFGAGLQLVRWGSGGRQRGPAGWRLRR